MDSQGETHFCFVEKELVVCSAVYRIYDWKADLYVAATNVE